ncbi:hypothetical protein KUW17_02685 [Leisingera aquaemixtae]|uniref:hypothetical protein n=1 Tax=Leisingera aquaemixtae TaxID=1396826 RepID=UPI001C9683B6|nr:hypothetical protein [Leisingera aquaemixtae]MBY6065630.1 hypothetical protein [Leisingera aquaemixtae]
MQIHKACRLCANHKARALQNCRTIDATRHPSGDLRFYRLRSVKIAHNRRSLQNASCALTFHSAPKHNRLENSLHRAIDALTRLSASQGHSSTGGSAFFFAEIPAWPSGAEMQFDPAETQREAGSALLLGNQKNACKPVWARPRISACTS